MKNRFLFSTLLVMFCTLIVACTPLPPAAKVALETVVKEGAVTPVNGLSTAGQPGADAFAVFAKSGYKTVIDLRGVKEERGLDEAAVLAKLKMSYVTLPIEGADDISFENAAKLDQLMSKAKGPVLLHCGSGNRVGALLALRESMHGQSDRFSLALGRRSGLTRLEDKVISLLDSK
jgi:uncharacterized protein (TIGR01244 family)